MMMTEEEAIISCLKEMSEKGNVGAQIDLAKRYMEGKDIPRDFKMASIITSRPFQRNVYGQGFFHYRKKDKVSMEEKKIFTQNT